MRGRILPALLIGAGSGLHLAATWRLAEAVFWPRAGTALFLLALLGAAAGAAAAFLAGGRGKERGESRQGWIFLLWGAAALGTLTALSGAATGPGTGVPGSHPAFLVFLMTLPPALAFAAPWGGSTPGSTDTGYFLAGAGSALGLSIALGSDPVAFGLAGIFIGTAPALAAGGKDAILRRAGAVVLIGAAVYLLAAGFRDGTTGAGASARWSDGGRIDAVEPGAGWGVIDVNRGLREVVYRAPSARALAFPIRPGADGRIDVLSLGFPRADVLRWLLGKGASVTVYEPDRLLAEEIRRRRPGLTEGDSVRFRGGDLLGTYLESREGALDLLILAAAPSPAAYLTGATAFREDYTTTVEAFRAYIRALAPRGLLFSERPGNGRVVTTLREAAPSGSVAFSKQVVVMGRKGRLVTQCWFSPAGFVKRDLKRMNDYAVREGFEIFISPQTRLKWSLYYNLVHGDLVKGYYFTTPRDLSPARDDRPFFSHFERLMISPAGKALPEERGLWQEKWGLRFIPPGDRPFWLVPAAGILLLPLMILLPAAVLAHRTGLARHGMGYPWIFLLLGISLAAALRALAGYGRLLGSIEGGGMPATAIFLAAAGAGWIFRPGRDGLWKGTGIPLAILFAVMGFGGYAFDGPRGIAGALFVILLASLAGLGAGRLASSLLHSAEDVLEGTLPWYSSFLILGAVTGWALSTLAAVFFGFPVLWTVAGAGLLAAARAGRNL